MWSNILNIFNADEVIMEYAQSKKLYATRIPWYKKILGYCPRCERYFRYGVKTTRRNTAYVEESNNWITACKKCREEDYEYFAELWNDYYSSIW